MGKLHPTFSSQTLAKAVTMVSKSFWSINSSNYFWLANELKNFFFSPLTSLLGTPKTFIMYWPFHLEVLSFLVVSFSSLSFQLCSNSASFLKCFKVYPMQSSNLSTFFSNFSMFSRR